ncbi:helix-turn-helix domain-containing protein [Micromonospora sp. 4G57]|uniref:Helix-turn-helix domain-containing protein n=1 Tax=Micromonospora sicca TaxID=2202420 RepID=A0ABU5JI68_9ACTN|nr:MULTISPECIES: helix-turn-helix domain-containing protein [unclassified Micromonospora]MDZ5442839.1 helix-turn-helix domain-containing protein [Micromonospora sp. 4G57]MDZ5492251.1 helix-turn-helix domain-containing protein [Micromonospora sp. 4G53]
MHPPEVRARARHLYLAGATVAEAARAVGVSYPTVRHWCKVRPEPKQQGTALRCFRCRPDVDNPTDSGQYAYLLGLYLGDGHLVTTVRVPVLRIFCADAWPGLIDACEEAMKSVLAASVQRVHRQGCVAVQSYGRHWPCLLPQHGPGKKHERPIVLAEWQREIVAAQPGDFLRGLFHSDGCRFSNRVTVRGKEYVYPRYMFTNESTDIMGLCQWALDQLGIAWKMNRRNSLSVARRDAVAALDCHVGPKS